MSRHRHRRPPPFADFINWTDYRWESNPWRPQTASRPWRAPRPHQRRQYNIVQILLAGLAVVAGVKLMSTLRNSGNRSWIERGILAVLLLTIASYVARRRQERW